MGSEMCIRDSLMPEDCDVEATTERLMQHGLQARRYYCPSISTGYITAKLNNPFGTPVSERLADRMLCLPLYTDSSVDEMEAIKSILIDNLGAYKTGVDTVSDAGRTRAA